ncbi:MAG TPA: 2-oxoacid:acceptor oxidoreductase family protein [Ktedonobacteraceae bacterium]
MSEQKITNIVMIGIGGQGALTMMEMLALAAEIAEREVHVLSRVSLARLGGVGLCHVRLGPCSSSAIPVGEADILLTLEMSEVLRALPMARPGAWAFVNCYRRLPIAAGVAGTRYPTQIEIEHALASQGIHSLFVPEQLPETFYVDEQVGISPTVEIPERAASAPSGKEEQIGRVNMSMLGVLCGFTELLPRPVLEEAIALRMPQLAQPSIQTFAAGWRFAQEVRAAL